MKKLFNFFLFLFLTGKTFAGDYSLPLSDSVSDLLGKISVTDCDDHVLLQWSVSNNLITDHFEVERMDINGSFKTIALILSDNKSTTSKYSYKDKITLRDLFLFYRVKAITNKGEICSSIITPLNLQSTGSHLTTVEFNPHTNFLLLHLSFQTGSYVCRFYNVVGKMVKSKTIHAASHNVLLNDLKNGTYFLEIYHPQTGKRYYASFVK